MGIYLVECPACKRQHNWFSGQPDQRCPDCVRNSVYPGALMIDDDKLRQEAEAAFLKSYTPDGKCNDEVEEMECARFVQGYLAHAAKAEVLAKELQYVVDQLVDRATWLQHRMEMD